MAREYRDDLGAAHQRIDQLERELAATREHKEDLGAAREQIEELQKQLEFARQTADLRSERRREGERGENGHPAAKGRSDPKVMRQDSELSGSTLFFQAGTGPVKLTPKGAWVFWILVGLSLTANLVVNLLLYPIARWQVLLQAILNVGVNLPAAAFGIAPALMGRHFLSKGPGWGALSAPARAGYLLGGLVVMSLFILALYKMGVANRWQGGDVF